MSRRDLLTILAAGLLLAATGLRARELPFELDLGLFRAEGNRSRLEVYISLDRQGVTYERERGRYTAHLAGVVLLKQRGQIIHFRELAIDDVVDNLDDGPQGMIFRQATFSLVPGAYDLQVVVEDRQGNRSDSTLQVEVPGYGGPGLEISAIQLAGLVRRSGGPKEFFKGGVTVWPDARSVYDNDRPLLWHYTEVYGLTPLDTLEIRTGIWRDSMELISLGPRRTRSPSLVFSDWGAINLSALAAGDYRLYLTISADGDSISTLKPFRVVRETPLPSDSGDVLAGLSPAELTEFARCLRLLPTELDLRRFRSTDSTGRRRMVEEAATEAAHGLDRDSSRHTGELLRHWGQVKAYERDWRSRRRLTEQGRTMFLYGPPATIETYPATSVLREYQIWTYTYADSTDQSDPDSLSGTSPSDRPTGQFVFVDREGYGEFTLVHATAPGAVWNENWRRELSWVPVPAAEPAAPAAEVIEEEAAAVVDTVRAEPAGGDSLAVPAVEVGEEDVISAPVDTVQAEPALIDTLTAPGPPAPQDTLTTDTAAVILVPSDTAAIDTAAVDSLLLEPAVNDTTATP